jgi:hypothetical protein
MAELEVHPSNVMQHNLLGSYTIWESFSQQESSEKYGLVNHTGYLFEDTMLGNGEGGPRHLPHLACA